MASTTEDQPPVDLSALAPPPTRAIRGEDAPIPLRENNGFDPAAWDAAAACGASGAATPVGTDRAGANIVAALNFNAKRVPFSPFDEASDGKLGSVYTRVTETLLHRGDWDRKPALRNKATGELKLPSSYGLLLGTAQGKGVPWGRLGYGVWPPPLVNYCRGFDMLTRKGKMQSTLEQGKEQFEGSWPTGMPEGLTKGAAVRSSDIWELAPTAFVFHPSKGDANPREALRAAYEARKQEAIAKHAADPASLPNGPEDGNRWILKPSEGAKGEGIFIETELEAIEAHLDKQEEKVKEGEAVRAPSFFSSSVVALLPPPSTATPSVICAHPFRSRVAIPRPCHGRCRAGSSSSTSTTPYFSAPAAVSSTCAAGCWLTPITASISTVTVCCASPRRRMTPTTFTTALHT